MSRLVIFDLETTEKYPLGQIVNLAAIAVNEKFEVIDKLYADVRISKTQLPSPDALLANRVKPREHQKKTNLLTERQALEKLFSFIDYHREHNHVGELIVGGQNIAKFDLEFVRSNALRSGLYPYFNRVVYGDLIFLSKKLAVVNEDFRKLVTKPDGDISIKLDVLREKLKISEDKQTHNSLDDCLLTLDIYKKYATDYDLNVFEYDPYEASNAKPGDVFTTANVIAGKIQTNSMCLHWQDKKYALWLNLSNFDIKKGKRNLWWKTKRNSSLIILNKVKDPSIIADAQEKRNLPEISDTSMSNYFDVPDCDPELHPTAVDIRAIDAAVEFMNTGARFKLEMLDNQGTKSYQNMVTFIERFNMLNKNGPRAEKLLKEYLIKRYSGKIKTQKNLFSDEPDYTKRQGDNEVYHPSLKDRLNRIEQLLIEKKDPEDIEILKDLKAFILESDVVKLCPELLKE